MSGTKLQAHFNFDRATRQEQEKRQSVQCISAKHRAAVKSRNSGRNKEKVQASKSFRKA